MFGAEQHKGEKMSTVKQQYAKVIDETTHEVKIGIGCCVSYYIEIGMTWMETELAYNGKWYVKGYAPKEPDPTPKTYEEVKEKRESLYREKVDPITAHISRLRDREQTPTTEAEIKRLINIRDYTYTQIQIENPYPVEGK